MKQKSGQVYHTGTYNNRSYTATLTEWGRILDIHMSQLERWLKQHQDIQKIIDIELADKQRNHALFRAFVFGGVCRAYQI